MKQKFDAAFGKILELVSVFKKASRKFIYIFLLNKEDTNLKNCLHMYRKYCFNFIALQEKYPQVTL
jgi:hypothetical protein